MTHSFRLRVYYEDTDFGGIVYYANYLKFIERARSEWVRSLGVDQRRMKEETGVIFAVRRVEADYLSPGHFDDELEVKTTVSELGSARVILNQEVWRGEVRLFVAVVTLVALGDGMRPMRLPEGLRSILE
jgi:acyl-CoA thioester hydrolase